VKHGSAREHAKGPAYYDKIFRESDNFNRHYSESRYLPVWEAVAEGLPPSARILEVGCGTGQLAGLLHDQGVRAYRGFDFSAEAVARARRAVPDFRFTVADARHRRSYRGKYNTVIATEVLEHLDDDLGLLAHLAPATIVRFTVPMRDDPSHVRFFPRVAGVRRRYGKLLAALSVRTVGQWHVGIGKVARR